MGEQRSAPEAVIGDAAAAAERSGPDRGPHAGAAVAAAPSAILQRRGQSQLDCNARPMLGKQPSLDSVSGDSTPTPSPLPLLARRKRLTSLTLNCSLIRGEETWLPAPGPQDEGSQVCKEYDVQEVLGQGSTGVVRRALRRSDGQEVCLKVIRTSDVELAETARKELALLKSLQHPHIVRGHDCISSATSVVLVLELFRGPTLLEAVRRTRGRRLLEDIARELFRGLIGAVAYLHANGTLHRDVKAENVLVSTDLRDLRLIDFNTAQRVADGGALTMTGTRGWAAPEVLRGQSPSAPHDVWGAGLCLFLMLAGRLPHRADRHRDADDYAADGLRGVAAFLREGAVSSTCRDALQACLEESPDVRSTAQELLACVWLEL